MYIEKHWIVIVIPDWMENVLYFVVLLLLMLDMMLVRLMLVLVVSCLLLLVELVTQYAIVLRQ